MATKTNPEMDSLIRTRRSEMAQVPDYEPPKPEGPLAPSDEIEAEATQETGKFAVEAPGAETDPEKFTYEPFTDVEGAWAVYPPGVPCDTAEYRISMSEPAKATDFESMKTALDEAAGSATPTEIEPLPEDEEVLT